MIPLQRDVILHELSPNRHIGQRLEILPETTSTNDICHDRSNDPADFGLIVLAEHQGAGRGRFGRTWSSPPGTSLLFSILLSPPTPLATPSFLVAWSAVAIAGIFRREFELPAEIKWPNDILIENRKLAGILVERRQATVVGIGINVSQQQSDFPDPIHLPASSLAIEVGAAVDRSRLAGKVFRELDDTYRHACEAGPEAIFDRWQTLKQDLVGQQVIAKLRVGEKSGMLLSIDPVAGAILRLADGTMQSISADELQRVEAITR